jgi:3-oxoacyl-[acyl-carrier protein] reductase
MKFKDQVVIVTGATRGIGRAIATAFAKEGAKVVITGRGQETCDSAAKEIGGQGIGSVIGVATDMKSSASLAALVDKVKKDYGQIDVLVNNAGVTRDNLLLLMSEDEWDDVLDTNLKGNFTLTRLVAKQMLRKKQGRIINMASVVGISGNAGQANYSASKGGLIAFTKTAARELAGRSITVNAVAPGFIRTDMTEKLPPEVIENAKKNIPLGEMGTPEDIAAAVLFLASPEAKYITGQVLNVDGGMVMA